MEAAFQNSRVCAPQSQEQLSLAWGLTQSTLGPYTCSLGSTDDLPSVEFSIRERDLPQYRAAVYPGSDSGYHMIITAPVTLPEEILRGKGKEGQ